MRIDASYQVNKLYQMNNTKRAARMNAANQKDSVEISDTGRFYQIAKQAVAQSPDIREDKVDALKQGMASGTYDVSMEELADKMVDSYFNKSI